MNRREIIKTLINKIDARSYLEIGLGDGGVYKDIKCKNKVSVDPCISDGSEKLNPTHKLTSDDFFAQSKDFFDVIFIDGLHEAGQVEKDINNSLKVLNDNGYIVCHDMSPVSEDMQIVPRAQSRWTGDCWKAWVGIRSSNPNLNMFVVDTDYGCGVIWRGSQQLLNTQGLSLTYGNLDKNRKEWLNLISVKRFKEEIG
mgnify:CR=1 FL=1